MLDTKGQGLSSERNLGWFVADDEWWTMAVDDTSIDASYRGDAPVLPPVVLLSSDGRNVSGAAIGRKSGRADSFRKNLRFTDWTPFDPFEITAALASLRGNSGTSANDTVSRGVGRFTPTASAHIIEHLAQTNSDATAALEWLFENRSAPGWLEEVTSTAATNYSHQLDGLKLGLEIAGFDRATALEKLPHPDQPDDLQLAALLEDQIVYNDVFQFLDWPSVPAVVSGAVFKEPATGRMLRTFLANKLPIETQTGADVIYYLKELNAFVLVQYKRCVMEGDVLRYRPDDQLAKEVVRMKALEADSGAGAATDAKNHRIGSNFCFIKLCEPKQPIDASMARGKYFDLTGFELATQLGDC